MSQELISTAEAAERMGRSKKWVELLIREKRLPATLIGHAYIIKASDVDNFEHRPRGRPPATPNKEYKPQRAGSKRSKSKAKTNGRK